RRVLFRSYRFSSRSLGSPNIFLTRPSMKRTPLSRALTHHFILAIWEGRGKVEEVYIGTSSFISSRRGRLAPVLSHHLACGSAPGGSEELTKCQVTFKHADQPLRLKISGVKGVVQVAGHLPWPPARVRHQVDQVFRYPKRPQFTVARPYPFPLLP